MKRVISKISEAQNFIEMQGLASLQKLLDLSNKSNASTNERINLS